MSPGPAERRIVLVVDDDPEVRGFIAEYLGLHGLDVLTAANGLEALLHLKRRRPQLVVLDLAMPRLGGLEVLRRIRAFDPRVKVAVVTGQADPHLPEQALGLGAVAVLPKPLDLARLGACFDLRAPAAADPAPAAAPAAAAAPAEMPRPPATGYVLVVDDDPDHCDMLQEFLALRGYEARAVADSAAALRAIVEREPDVVLLDIEMAGLSGTDALPAIRAVGRAVKVIMVSGTTSVETSKRALALGAFDYVVKPVDFEYLARSIEAALTMKALEA